MPDLITAKEWADRLREHSFLGAMDIDTLEKGFRAVQRNFGEAAAKHLRHQADCADAIDEPSDAALWRLAAMHVMELIPETPAPAGKETKATDPACADDTRLVIVCDKCQKATCWQGILYCDDYHTAGAAERTVAELRKLDLEHPSHWEA